MTTWAGAASNLVRREFLGRSRAMTYKIAGIAGDTGGTLTVGGIKVIDNYSVQVEIATGPAGYNTGLVHYTLGKTIVVAYTNPADTHTVRIKVWGPQ